MSDNVAASRPSTPPLPRTDRTRLVPPPVLIGHAASGEQEEEWEFGSSLCCAFQYSSVMLARRCEGLDPALWALMLLDKPSLECRCFHVGPLRTPCPPHLTPYCCPYPCPYCTLGEREEGGVMGPGGVKRGGSGTRGAPWARRPLSVAEVGIMDLMGSSLIAC
jgi:hypothetical protein